MVDDVTEKPPGRVRGAAVSEHSHYNLKRNPAADSLQVQRIVTYRTTKSRKMPEPHQTPDSAGVEQTCHTGSGRRRDGRIT
jgi:hypothetical protein